MQLLKALHRSVGKHGELELVRLQSPDTAPWFVNKKLTAKLDRQLDEPMVVASACLPEWALSMPADFPFLFPFETRWKYLQSTGLGYARVILHWQNQQRASETGRQEESFGFLSRLQRQKVRVSRRHLLGSAVKVFDTYASHQSILEVEYFDEVGTGLAPTLEFYSTVSQDFALQANDMWLGEHSDQEGGFVQAPHGLYPIPTTSSGTTSSKGTKRLDLFRTLGIFVAKALADSRLIQLNLSPLFVDRVLGRHVSTDLDTLKQVDPGLVSSLEAMRQLSADDVEGLDLNFTLPSDASYELLAGGASKAVTGENLESYISAIADAVVGSGITAVIAAFREGFNRILNIDALQIFSAVELVTLFGNAQEDWSEETLRSTVKPDHGYTVDSSAYRDLVAILAEFDHDQRRQFLQWLTGSPKLPIGGFKSLQPPFTVVKRPCDPPLKPDDYLPSAMSCALYCKIPDYSSRAVMKQRLLTAITEGAGSFHLS